MLDLRPFCDLEIRLGAPLELGASLRGRRRIDVDGLDPTEAPGTGVPEPGGLSMRDSQVMLRALTGLEVVGGDVCEVAPPLDPSGLTCIATANLMFEILCLIATARAARRTG
jgi:guanidinopropionase